MKIEEILMTSTPADIAKAIFASKPQKHDKEIKRLREEWDVNQHRVIVDKEFLPDKDIKDKDGNIVRKKEVNRIAVPYQKMIVNRAVAFGFANDVLIRHNTENDATKKAILAAVQRVLHENKESTFNRKISRDLYRAKEVAEIWYFEQGDTEHTLYGFKTKYRLRCMHLSAWKDNTLYPIFNEFQNLKAFGRSFTLQVNGKNVPTVDIYTDTETRRFAQTGSAWTEIEAPKSGVEALGKIPIVYASQEQAEWEDVRTDIERLELLLSKHAEINDYHASPKTFVKGKLRSMPVAGEANPVLNGDENTDVKILSWQDAPDSIKLEIETRLENIHKFTQTADVSFKNIKGLSQVSGVMLKMLFMDVHLKIMEKNEVWDEYFTRRYNLIKSMLAALNPAWQQPASELELTPIIEPFMIKDSKELVETLMTANGNLPIMTHERSVELLGETDDAAAEVLVIAKQQAEQALTETSEPMTADAIPADV